MAKTESPGGDRQLIEALADLAHAGKCIANSIAPVAAPGTDATGGSVSCLTEAVMGVTAGLIAIAEAMNNVAEAIREKNE